METTHKISKLHITKGTQNVIISNYIITVNVFHNLKENLLTTKADIIVVTEAPINPSHVFFGDNLIRGVFPKKNPKK